MLRMLSTEGLQKGGQAGRRAGGRAAAHRLRMSWPTLAISRQVIIWPPPIVTCRLGTDVNVIQAPRRILCMKDR